MLKNRYQTIAFLAVLLFGAVLFYVGTDGFTAYTAETARVNQLIENKPQFPEVTLEDSLNNEYRFSEFKDRYVLITFFYTSCTTVCLELELNMSMVLDSLPKEYVGEEIVFLSISFDPERDHPERLNEYAGYFNADEENWRMARINDPVELKNLLDEFGVIVIPDDYGNIAHNSAFYLVDKEGSLIDVMDYKEVDEASQKVRSILDKEVGKES
ncbi:SCO family protein [Sporosarcina sp. FA9]|uniref:SCO family protein n=1 Tax=Sporosarcina sp. FA9 TaxID=3413030 RepID=UPI003F657DF9